ncbi:MAG: MFS transporter [Endomicrobiales bacterium]|jgi:MFS family permease
MKNVIRSTTMLPLRRSLDYCWREGVASQVIISIFDYYLIPYALFTGASSQQIGLLMAIPGLLSAFSQLYAVHAVNAAGGSRKNLLMAGLLLQAAILIPMPFLQFVPSTFRITALIVLVTLFRVFGSLTGTAWGSLVSDYLPDDQRGQYFGWRQRMVSIAGIASVAFWGGALYLMKEKWQSIAFAAIFASAIVFRLLSYYFATHMTDIPVEQSAASNFTLRMFMNRFKKSNFARFVIFVTGMTFATQLTAPYFSVHMLQNLHFNYLQYVSVHLASIFAGLIAFPLWGRNADRVGNAKVLKSTSVLLPLIPLLWMFATRPLELICIEFLSGFAFSGFTIATSNFIYDSVTPAKRVRYLGYFNLINGIAIFAGASLGGYLAQHLPPIRGYPIVTLFLVSTAIRFFADFFLSPHFAEVRPIKARISSVGLYLSVVGIRPFTGENVDLDILPPLRPPRTKYEPENRSG